jgi:hypothetical protein
MRGGVMNANCVLSILDGCCGVLLRLRFFPDKTALAVPSRVVLAASVEDSDPVGYAADSVVAVFDGVEFG